MQELPHKRTEAALFLFDRQNRHDGQPPVGTGDLFESRLCKVDLSPQPFAGTAIIHPAYDPLPVQRVNDQELFSERKIPGGAGTVAIVELFTAGRPLVDVPVRFAVPGSDPES